MVTDVTNSGGAARPGLFFVRLRARTSLIESREEEDLGDKFAVRTVYAIPKEIHDELTRWRVRTWKRIMSRPTVKVGPLTLFPASEYDAVLTELERARREYEDIVARIEDPEAREKFTCNPTVMFVSAAPGFEGDLSREISEQVLKRVEEALSRTVDSLARRGDEDVARRLGELERILEERMKALEGRIESVASSKEATEAVKRLEVMVAAVASSDRVNKRDLSRIRGALEAAERFSELLTPEAREALGRIRERVNKLERGERIPVAEAASRLAREVQKIVRARAEAEVG